MASPVNSTPLSDQSDTELTVINLDLSGNFTDADVTDTLTFSISGLPTGTGLTFNAVTAVLSGVPTAFDVSASPISAVITCTDGDDNFQNMTVILELEGAGNPEPPDFVVRQDGAGTHTTFAGAIAAASAGDIIEVQANTVGGTQIFTENVDINAKSGASGNEIELRARSGDTIRIRATSAASTVFQIRGGASFWYIHGFASIGHGTWTNAVPWPTVALYPQKHGIRVYNNAHHIDIQDIGTLGSTTDAIYGANNYSANLIGGFGNTDGVHHIRVKNCNFYLQGNNANVGWAGGDWGDLFIMRATNSIVEGNAFVKGGHNALSIFEGKCIVRRNITDNNWISEDTGKSGQRSAAIAGDQAAVSSENILTEFNVFRWGLAAGDTDNPPVCKDQARGGIFRFNTYYGGAAQAIQANRNNGADGSVTQSKWYHYTVINTDSVFRQTQTSDEFNDIYFEQSHINALYQQLGGGDNLSAGVYIYKHDEGDHTGYGTGWKGDEWRGITYEDTTDIEEGYTAFKILLNDDTGAAVTKTVLQATTDWSANFANWDMATVNFVDDSLASVSWDIDAIIAGMVPASPPASVADVEPLTLMDGAGVAATTGTLDDGRFFCLKDTDLDLSYFDEINDYMWIESTRVQIVTLNKATGAVTFTPAATWSDNAEVFADCSGSKVTKRGASQ
jgi:hypothetical protein